MVVRWLAWQFARRRRSRRHAAERARGRAGEGASSVDRPLARFCEHANESPEDFVVRIVQLVEVILLQVAAAVREFETDAGLLGFALCISYFTNKPGLVTALAPSLCDIGAH